VKHLWQNGATGLGRDTIGFPLHSTGALPSRPHVTRRILDRETVEKPIHKTKNLQQRVMVGFQPGAACEPESLKRLKSLRFQPRKRS
jgi:hypothetical protein